METDRTKLNWRAIALVAAGIALTSAGHYLTPSSLLLWHGIFQRLYYLPVVFAAITFGWVGGLIAALAAGVVPTASGSAGSSCSTPRSDSAPSIASCS